MMNKLQELIFRYSNPRAWSLWEVYKYVKARDVSIRQRTFLLKLYQSSMIPATHIRWTSISKQTRDEPINIMLDCYPCWMQSSHTLISISYIYQSNCLFEEDNGNDSQEGNSILISKNILSPPIVQFLYNNKSFPPKVQSPFSIYASMWSRLEDLIKLKTWRSNLR